MANVDLTQREADVLRLIWSGMKYSEIAEALHIATGTVGHYARNLHERFQARTMPGVCRNAVKTGWLTP